MPASSAASARPGRLRGEQDDRGEGVLPDRRGVRAERGGTVVGGAGRHVVEHGAPRHGTGGSLAAAPSDELDQAVDAGARGSRLVTVGAAGHEDAERLVTGVCLQCSHQLVPAITVG